MRGLAYLALLLLIPFYNIAQNGCVTYMPAEGTKMTYFNFDKKGKQQSSTTTEIRSVKTKGDTTIYKVHQLVSTGKEKNDYASDMIFKCEGNNFVVDMQTILNSEQMAAYQDASLVVETEDMYIPSNLSPGMELNDASIKVMVKMDYMTTNITARAFYREVVAREEITTPAGNYDSWKIEGNVESKIAFMRMAVKTVEWYVEDVGVVRSETFDNKGKMLGYTELQSME